MEPTEATPTPSNFSAIARRVVRRLLYALATLVVIALLVAAALVYWEMQTSNYQADYLSKLATELHYKMQDGPNPEVRITQAGPYDVRLGYSLLPTRIPRLELSGFAVTAQARISPRMQELVNRGLFVPYHEKDQAGLTILDASDQPFYGAVSPLRIYDSFTSIPPLLVDSLLYIENRELLDLSHPKKNPAVNWARLAHAAMDKAIQYVIPSHDVPGGSTLATQIEKYRHSPGGLTLTIQDKLQQMASASVRAYLDGEDTLPARKQIVLSYLNTVPLSAVTRFGEVNGIGDGMWAWFGLDFDRVNHTLNAWTAGNGDLSAVASDYKHALSLMIAQRRPSEYLGNDHASLEALTNDYLRLLATEGVIPAALRDAALQSKLSFRQGPVVEDAGNYVTRKAANAVRLRLASLLGLDRLYDVDRLDLTVKSTLNSDLQQKVTAILRQFKNPAAARAAGLYGARMLGAADPGRIIFSLNLNELTPEGAKPRIQADNFDQPFDINEGTKLDLGSTAKLRTLVTYLEIVETLHQKYADLSPDKLRHIEVSPGDHISQWAIEYLLESEDHSLPAMLSAALDRSYSADPRESFFTGGGVQYFKNFKHEDDDKVLTLREATRNSVNLVFIRLMRDIEYYFMFDIPGSSANILKDVNNPQRQEFLKRFADREGQEFMARFYKKYRGKSSAEIADIFFSDVRPAPARMAAAFRYVFPKAPESNFVAFMVSHIPSLKSSGQRTLQDMYDRYGPGKFSLADQGYIARVHPLELWLVGYLISHPVAHFDDAVKASSAERIMVYRWLLNTSRKNAQDSRIRSLLEVEAFLEIHRHWKRLGYPFDSIVPSLATAIGSSADRPGALADLMGIILNNGVRVPKVMIESMHFATGTPFETEFTHQPVQGERMFSADLAMAVRGVLTDVVEHGTASRLAKAITLPNGTRIPIGGKTGTGDHRYVTFSAPGVIKESRAVNRSATFVFFIGDRFFGTLTAFVPGTNASKYSFTSALSAQTLKYLLPTLMPLIATAQPLPEQKALEASGASGDGGTKDMKSEPESDDAVDSSQQPAPESD